MTDQREAFTSNEQADATARVVGVALLCAGLGIAYLVWPTGASETALAAMTLATLLRVVAAIAIGLLSLFGAVMFWM
jgi:hypothetical protein